MPRAVLVGQLAAIALVLSSSPALARPAVVVHVDRSGPPAVTVATADHRLHVARGPDRSLSRGRRVALSPSGTVTPRPGRARRLTFTAVVERSRLRLTRRQTTPLATVDRVAGPALRSGDRVTVT